MTDWRCPLEAIEIGTGRMVSESKGTDGKVSKTAILSFGPLGNTAQEAIRIISENDTNASLPAHYDMRFLKPLDEKIMHIVAKNYDHIITIEDGALNGGFGSAVLEWLSDNGHTKKVTRLGIPDTFIEHGSPAQLYKICGLNADSIVKAICV